jgi:hypothetical protein
MSTVVSSTESRIVPGFKNAFTRTTIQKCPNCKKSINPDDIRCACGQFLLRITLQPKQRKLYDMVRATGATIPTILGLGGGRGSAKSRAGRDIALLTAFANPGVTVYIFARNLTKCEENYTEKYRIERPGLMKYYKASSPPEFAFPPELGGSRIAFRYGDTLADILNFARGPEGFLIIIEQAEAFSEQELQEINTPNRWPGAKPGQAKTVHLFNIGGRGTDYHRRVFYLRQFKDTEKPHNFHFQIAFGWDNYAWFENENIEIDGEPLTFEKFYSLPGEIPPCEDGKYTDAWLASVPDEKHYRFKLFVTQTTEGRKMWAKPESIRLGDLFASFEKFAGQYYEGVWDEKKCVIPARLAEDIVKSWWPHWIGLDWGFNHSAAAGLLATGKLSPSEFKKYFGKDIDYPIDVVIIKKELVADHTGEGKFVSDINGILTDTEKRMVREIFVSPDAKHKRGSSDTVLDQLTSALKQYKLPTPDIADDDRKGGARLIWNCLKQTCSVLSDVPEFYPGGFPMLLVSTECPQVISMFPMLIVDPDNREDVLKTDTTYDDVFDGVVRYPLKSKLNPNSRVPIEVQRREVLQSVGEDPNARAMAMRQFEARQKQATGVISRPRWRI